MRTYPSPDNVYDQEELAELNAEPWMLELLKLNPSYVFWGPHEDYMWKEKEGWDSRKVFDSWKEFGPWTLDELNECVNFYFQIDRHSKKCPVCNGNSCHPDAQWVSESFYSSGSPFTEDSLQEQQSKALMERFGGDFDTNVLQRGSFPSEEILAKYGPEFRAFCEAMRDGDGYWHDKITQDEVEALVASQRLSGVWEYDKEAKEWKKKADAKQWTAEEVNANQHIKGRGFLGHDGINRSILIEARCKRLGLPYMCDECKGNGSVPTAPGGHVNLVLWWLHPRKGASRGIEVQNIQEAELPEIFAFLKQAAVRNAQRFEHVLAKTAKEEK